MVFELTDDCFSQITFNTFTPDNIWNVVLVVILLCMSALISGSETAFFSLTPRNVRHFKSNPSPVNNAILKLLSMQDYLLATILIANNFVNICVVLVSNNIINSWINFGNSTGWEFAVKIVIVTFLLLLFGEIMPKIMATYNPVRFAGFMARPLLVMKSFFKPLSYLLIRSSNTLNERVARKKVNISMDELSDAIEMTVDQNAEEKKMLSGIVSFVNTDVVDVMKPRVDIIALDVEDNFAKVKKVIIDSGFSRIPVYEETLDNIKGILYVKDVLPYIKNDDDFGWQHLARKPYFVPEYKKINDLMSEFQNNQVHLAIVVDEYGSTLGLVSLEDILEEIVGEISDESDTESQCYTKVEENTYIFEGKTHINDMLKILELPDDYLDEQKGEADTVAGLMLEIRRDFLKKGDVVVCKALTLSVEEAAVRRIDKVKVVVDRGAL